VEPSDERTARCARIILDLDRKLAGGDRRPKQQWPVRLNEVVGRLIEINPGLAEALLSGLSSAGHLSLVDLFPAPARLLAAKRYLKIVHDNPAFEWSPELVNLLGRIPEAHALLRSQWKNLGLRPSIRKVLEQYPSAENQVLLAETPVPPMVIGNVEEFTASLKDVKWEQGDPARGEKVFTERACATCHSGTSPLGPELSGPVARLSPVELMTDIQFPSRNISDAFRSTNYTLKDGTQRSGFIVFHSADGVMLQIGPGMTERIPETSIVSREPSPVSLMPAGLLSGLSPEQFADFYAYLRTLKAN
jgi:putative heme-binding domain-containing protein